MPKPVYATADELEAGIAKVEGQVTACKGSIGPAVTAAETKLKAELDKLTSVVTKNANIQQKAVEGCGTDAKAYADDVCEKLRSDIGELLSGLEGKLNDVQQGLTANLQQVDKEVRQTLANELAVLCERIDKEFASARSDFAAADDAKAADAVSARAQQRAEIDARMEHNQKEAERQIAELDAASQTALQKAVETQQRADARREERTQTTETEIWLKLDRHDELCKELEEKIDQEIIGERTKANEELTAYTEGANAKIENLDKDSLTLRTAMLEVENLSTRRVDWVIKKASLRLRPNSASKASLHTSWFSPKFDIAGAHGVQLELQLYRSSEFGAADEAAGDVAVFLWACRGMNLVYKLHVGGKSQTMEKVFNGRVPYGTKRFCFMRDQINKEDDTLKIGVEILESVREIEHVVKPPAPPNLEGFTDAQAEIELAAHAKQLECSLMFRRNVNNRLLEQVKTQVEAMRSRMVRRVEWRVEQGAMLRKCFASGESMCSASFAAAGVEGLQFIFYPSGYGGATDGFCSLYLFAPAGATLKCNLCVGTQKRDANNTWEESGAFGRMNYCRLETVIDPETDSITIALEVQEAHQDMAAKVAHPATAPGDRRNLAQLEGSSPAPIESTVKLQRSSGRGVGGRSLADLEEKRMLPSLWSAKSLADGGGRGAGDPGFKSFDALRGGARGSPGGTNLNPHRSPSNPGRAGPMVGFMDETSMDFGPGETTPLPKLKKGAGAGGEWGRTSSEWSVDSRSKAGRQPAARRSRSEAGTRSPDI
eukprot:CAMPEP_0115082562 /NCGR_PEP_ID=MMETSP0227-20121206/19982_1 /TAXON_ID=89957 /ORGANISM="Polarella glacialis, Strain CCMP 1383" /LENGTH=769 /DNA_ID=CAMNT_0002470689 /DNA_START=76 /DNA_END=2385 /DNA_ORIENTATION=+